MPTIAVFAPNPVDAEHLVTVTAEMTVLGAPTLRAVETAHGLVSIEGSHRLASAEALALTPILIVIGCDELVEGSTLNDIRTDVWASCNCDGTSSLDFRVSGAELANFLGSPAGSFHRFEP